MDNNTHKSLELNFQLSVKVLCVFFKLVNAYLGYRKQKHNKNFVLVI